MNAQDQKKAVGEAAAQLVEPGMVVGLGTGSTAVEFVKALAARKLDIDCVSTSVSTADLATELGLKVIDLDAARRIDLTIDGADEIGPGLALIKGAGGALLCEKLVWEASNRCVVIADASKRVPLLGRFPLPIEVVPFGHETTLRRIVGGLADAGIAAVPTLRAKDGQPYRTDSGNLIYDAPCGMILDPPLVEAALKSITGVVDHGLFLGLAERALVATEDGVVTVWP